FTSHKTKLFGRTATCTARTRQVSRQVQLSATFEYTLQVADRNWISQYRFIGPGQFRESKFFRTKRKSNIGIRQFAAQSRYRFSDNLAVVKSPVLVQVDEGCIAKLVPCDQAVVSCRSITVVRVMLRRRVGTQLIHKVTRIPAMELIRLT